MSEEIINSLATLIAEKILKKPGRTIQAGESLISSGLIDSFHLVDLALTVEDEFGVRIDDTELNVNTFDTLAQLADLVASRKA
jgi:acyl carrier protein